MLFRSFVSVGNPSNDQDDGVLYLYENSQYLPAEIPNIGIVHKNYRIGKYEITNAQYVNFLNAVATENDRALFSEDMSNEDAGGITREGDGSLSPYEYSVKTNMDDKPVLFISYLSAIRFINWLHNGAPLSDIDNIDQILDFGAYDIFPIGEGSYLVNKNVYQKYWLPNLNEWHKAAYFEPRENLISTGSSAVLVKREDPYVVSSGSDQLLLANLSVSGWLYVDHLIVGDNVSSSSTIPKRTLPGPGDDTTNFACATNADCHECEVCSNGICSASTDPCCVANCCKPGKWDAISAVCLQCADCDTANNENTGSSELPCELLGTC